MKNVMFKVHEYSEWWCVVSVSLNNDGFDDDNGGDESSAATPLLLYRTAIISIVIKRKCSLCADLMTHPLGVFSAY
jgi:hypothetical protein